MKSTKLPAKKKPSSKTTATKRGADPKMADDARSKLDAITLAERIAAVAADRNSKRDEYRSIASHELADLLGINLGSLMALGNPSIMFDAWDIR